MATEYKILSLNGKPINGGSGVWILPLGKEPGKWMPKVKDKIVACQNGYHLTDLEHLVDWVCKENIAIYEAEDRGDKAVEDDKTAYREARLIRLIGTLDARKLRLFACDCAERALKNAEVTDERSWNAVAVSRRYADGKATVDELSAAYAVAYAAADAVANAAAYAARRAEKKWQGDRLLWYAKQKSVDKGSEKVE